MQLFFVKGMRILFGTWEHRILLFLSGVLFLNTMLFSYAFKTDPEGFTTQSIYHGIFFLVVMASIGTIFFFHAKFLTQKTLVKMLLLVSPTALSITLLRWLYQEIAWEWMLLSGLFYIGLGSHLLLSWKKTTYNNPRPKRIAIPRWSWVMLLVIMIIQFGFGSYRIGEQALVDESLWVFDRIENYWQSIAQRDWKNTRVNDKPGITVAIVSGVGLLWEDPTSYITLHSAQRAELYKALRYPILLTTTLFLPLFFYLLTWLLGYKNALLATMLIAFHPILLGASQMINPDSLFWALGSLALLSYLSFLLYQKFPHLVLTGALLGLALLTKYVANILLVFFLFALLLFLVMHKWESKEQFTQFLRKNLIDYIAIVFIAIALFYIILPATWIKPLHILNGTLLSEAFITTWPYYIALLVILFVETFLLKNILLFPIIQYIHKWKTVCISFVIAVFFIGLFASLANVWTGMQWINFEEIIASPKSAHKFTDTYSFFISHYYSLFFGISGLLLFFFIIGAGISLREKWSKEKQFILVTLIAFILLYYLGATLTEVGSTVRYQIILYPLALILASVGAFWIVEKIKKSDAFPTMLTLLFATSLYSLWSVQPFYFSYAADTLPKQFVLNLKDMGDGSFEAAQYLNALPNAHDLSIWTDKNGVCNVFVGKCASSLDFKRYILEERHFDYYVVSSGREAKNVRDIQKKLTYNPQFLIRFDKLYSFDRPEFILELGGRKSNFVKVINANDIDITHEQIQHLPKY